MIKTCCTHLELLYTHYNTEYLGKLLWSYYILFNLSIINLCKENKKPGKRKRSQRKKERSLTSMSTNV